MSGTIHVRGSGGAVWEMTLPLPEYIRKQYEAGELVQVNPDGSPYGETVPRKRRGSRAESGEAPAGD